MKALTIDAPWAWAIVNGHKRFENRTWRTRHRGPLAIHASKSARGDAAALVIFAELGIEAPTREALDALRGCVLGTVNIGDCVRYPIAGGDGRLPLDGDLDEELRRDPFATGPVCWLLAGPVMLLTPVPVIGKQALWELPAGTLGAVGTVATVGRD